MVLGRGDLEIYGRESDPIVLSLAAVLVRAGRVDPLLSAAEDAVPTGRRSAIGAFVPAPAAIGGRSITAAGITGMTIGTITGTTTTSVRPTTGTTAVGITTGDASGTFPR